MKIINKTRNTVLADNVRVADSFFLRMRGLLREGKCQDGWALVIKPCNSVQTLFMRRSIDIIFLNKESKVAKIVNSLRPFRFSPICLGSKFVIELPPGTIKSSGTQESDLILIEGHPSNQSEGCPR